MTTKAAVSKQVYDVAGKALGIAADSNVGFRFIGTILEAVGELAATNPGLATRLAEAGTYWVDRLEYQMSEHQDNIEEIMRGASADHGINTINQADCLAGSKAIQPFAQ